MILTKGARSFVVLTVLFVLFLGSGFSSLTHAATLSGGSSYPVPTLRLPFNGSYPIAGYSYGCGDHVDNRNNGAYDDSYALDFALPYGTPVVAATSGLLREGITTGIGNYAYVETTLTDKHTLTGYVTEYGHLSNNHVLPSGTWVSQGTVIGISGNSGGVPAHLHFSLRAGYNGTNLFGNSATGAHSIAPEPMSGYVDFKYYGYSSARGTAPQNCQPTDVSTKFSSSNTMTTRTMLSEELPLTGISYKSGDTKNPQPSWSYVETQVFNTKNLMVADVWNQAVYRSLPGLFVDHADLGTSFPSGDYYVKIRMNNTLSQTTYGIHINNGGDTYVPLNPINAADVDNNNRVDISDYNDLMNCYRNLPACTSTLRAGSDLNRDGQVNGVDYNLWLIERYR